MPENLTPLGIAGSKDMKRKRTYVGCAIDRSFRGIEMGVLKASQGKVRQGAKVQKKNIFCFETLRFLDWFDYSKPSFGSLGRCVLAEIGKLRKVIERSWHGHGFKDPYWAVLGGDSRIWPLKMRKLERCRATSSFQFPGTAEEAVFRQAHVKVVKSFDEVAEIMKSDIPLQDESNKVANTMKVRHEGSWTRLDILIFGLTLEHLEDGHLKTDKWLSWEWFVLCKIICEDYGLY